MNEHLTQCIAESEKHHIPNVKKRGRGSLITFLLNNTINKVITSIYKIMQERIVEEIKEAGMFSVQIDTTMDVSFQDQ